MKYQSGITLIEVLITVSVLAIVAAIGVPNFRTLIENNQVRASTNDLSAALHLARSEAIKTRTTVSLCVKAAAQNICDQTNNADWNNGWLVVRNDNVIRAWDNRSASLDINNTDGHLRFNFSSNGRVLNIVNSNFTVDSTGGKATTREISISQTGRVRVGVKDD